MATCLDIITYALRMTGVVAFGRDAKAAEAEEGMAALQSLYDQWRTNGMFGKLEDTYLDDDATAEEGKRYYVPAGAVLTAPTSEITDNCGKVRQPRDLALYEALTASGTQTAMLYDRTQWVSLLDLSLVDDAPLSSRGTYGLAAALVIEGGFPPPKAMNVQIDQTTAELARNFVGNLMGKSGSTQDSSGAEFY
jgi:hypothetical protein